MAELFGKFCRFLLVSGVGWVMDFGIYTGLTVGLDVPVAGANYLSSLPAITFVFFVSTRKILISNGRNGQKYLAYVVYQFLLVTAVSFLAQWLAAILPLPADWGKLGAKVIITPITMVANFFVLKWIAQQ